MNKKIVKRSALLLLLFMSVFFILSPKTARAASLTKSTPKITKAYYIYNSVQLQWKKVTGAKKYKIYRRVMNPKTGKYGKWKYWAATAKTSIKKKATGDCQYRIIAVNGKKHSKWSAKKRIFAACAKILDKTYESGGFVTIKVKITNKSGSPMGLMKAYVDDSRKSQIQFYKNSKKVDTYSGDWYSGNIWTDDGYVTDTIPAKSSKTLYLRTSIASTTWWNYPMFGDVTDLEHHVMKIVSKFYPNPSKENKTLKITYTTNVKKSFTR